MKQRADKTWTYEELNDFLAAPKADIPGTKMTFPGLPKLQDRANVIAWLRTLSDSPVPLPSDADIAAAQKAYDDAKAAAAKPAARPPRPRQRGAAQPAATQTAAAAAAPIAERLKTADPAKGEQISKKCRPATTSPRAGPTRSDRTCGTSSAPSPPRSRTIPSPTP